jgi:tol-pal system protein YbgF
VRQLPTLALTCLALTCLGITASGCASFFEKDPARAGNDVDELKKRVLELQRQSAVNEVELSHLRQRVAELESQLGTERSRPSPEPAPPRSAPATPGLTRAEQEIEDLEMEPLADVEPPSPPAPGPAGPAPTTPSPPPPPPSTPTATLTATLTSAAQALYDRGYTLYHQGDYIDAEASFQRFLQQYGATELGDNAQYWIGESRYARRDLPGALAAFRATVERFPKGNKVPDALLKAGQCLEGLGNYDGARASYEEVSRRFPGTQAAVLADQRRGRLP